MNERVKELRQALGLSGEKFGEKIGLSRFAISNIENGKNSVTDQTIKLICLTYNVNEDWLRTGEGEMFIANDGISLDELISKNNVDPLEIDILKAYFSLPKDIRKSALDYFMNNLTK
ncbi:helix-turn-helix domain-containing protein [Peptoniphilus sp. SGI.035]|uniref:helix-turn-helix domain-containing protein n=1 Tax=Peptoniphilus sp. SGI.035 TaxID=3420564 RepID=UPI003D03D5AF